MSSPLRQFRPRPAERRGWRPTLCRAALGLALLLSIGCSVTGGPGEAPSGTGQTAPGLGAAAPDFTLVTLRDGPLALSTLRGNAVVLNFWASWCAPCRTEMPYFEATYQALRHRGVVFIGVAIQDDLDSSRAFADELRISYPVGLDSENEIARRYQVLGLPTTVFIARDGTLARKWSGPLEEKQLLAFVEEIAG